MKSHMVKSTQKLGGWLIASAIVASILLIVANSAIWVNRNLFDTNKFTNTAVASLTSEPSRRALSSEITDIAFADYPKVQALVGDRATEFISGLLGSEQAEKITTKAVSKLQVKLTSPPRENPVEINLVGLKDTLNKLIEVSGREGETKIDPNKIPDKIVLLNPDNIPNFYNAGVVLGWLSPLLVLLSIALLAWPYFKKREIYTRILALQGSILLLFGLLALAIGPLFKPMLISNVDSTNLRIVVGNLYDAFIASFNSQTLFLVFAGLISILASASIHAYRYYKK